METGHDLEKPGYLPRRMGDSQTSTTPLVDALRALRGASGELAQKAARSRLVDVVDGPVRRLVRSRVAHPDRAKEIIQDSLLAIVLEKTHQCRAPLLPDAAKAERVAWGWVLSIVRRRIYDASSQWSAERKKQAEESALEALPAAIEEEAFPLEQVLDLAEQGARELIESGHPAGLYQQARSQEVAATLERVARDIDSWRQVKVHGRKCLDVGLERGATGPEPRIRNLISKQVERGKKALYFGALAAVGQVEDEALRGLLEQFARGLLAVETGP